MDPKSHRYAIVDIETTGANRDGSKITEIGIVCVDDGVVTEEWSTLINPEMAIPWGITALTGIDDAMVENAPRFCSVAKKIVELTEGRTFVAHNAFFDYRFIQREFSELGYTFQRDVLCTVRLARKAFPGLSSYKLTDLSKHFSLIRLAEHRALDDAKACFEIFQRVQKTDPEALITAAPKPLPQGLDDGTIEKIPKMPGNYFFYSERGTLLYIGKAKNMRDRVKSHFQSVGASKRQIELRQKVARVETREWGSELVAELMELQLIKTMKPLLNRVSTRTDYRYTLVLRPDAAPGEEVKVETTKDKTLKLWHSRHRALEARSEVYLAAFGVEADSLFFLEKMQQYHKILGAEQVTKRLAEKLIDEEFLQGDHMIKLSGRKKGEKAYVIVRQGQLQEVRFEDHHGELEIHPLENYPDMKLLVVRHLQAV